LPLVNDFDPYLLISDVFSIDVPGLQYGTRPIRTCFDVPMTTEGARNCRVGGWWIMIRFNKPGKKFLIKTYCRGAGQYQASMLWQINVSSQISKISPPASILSSSKAQAKREDWSRGPIVDYIKKLSSTGQINKKYGKFAETILAPKTSGKSRGAKRSKRPTSATGTPTTSP
jgi:hypothetical protein